MAGMLHVLTWTYWASISAARAPNGLFGPTSGSWVQIRPPRAAQGPPGPPKGPIWAKTGPFGGPRSAVVVSYGAPAHDMDAAHAVGPTSGTWAEIRPPGRPRAPKRAFLGQNGPFSGPPEGHSGLVLRRNKRHGKDREA